MKIKVIPSREHYYGAKIQSRYAHSMTGRRGALAWMLIFGYVPKHFDQYLEDITSDGLGYQQGRTYYDTYRHHLSVTTFSSLEYRDDIWNEETEEYEENYDYLEESCKFFYKFEYNEVTT